MPGRKTPAVGSVAAKDPYAPFRPRWGRGVARVVSVIVLLTFAFAAITVPGQEGQKGDWTIADRLLIFLSGVGIAYFLHRYSTIIAVPSRQGLFIRNILRQHTLSWSEVLRLQYGGGAPWASVDLIDTDTIAVMAIQKVDGAHATAMAGRLAALIQVHGETAEPENRTRS